MYWKIYALFLICFGILNPIINYNNKYECLPYGQDFITSNAIFLSILLFWNAFIFYPVFYFIFDNIKFSQWLDLNIIFSIILSLLIICSNQQFI